MKENKNFFNIEIEKNEEFFYNFFYYNANLKKFSTGNLLNNYLTKKFKKEGFKKAKFELVCKIKTKSSKEDIKTYNMACGDYAEQQMRYNMMPAGSMSKPIRPILRESISYKFYGFLITGNF
ncbi:MAG: hypothetical protein IJW82_02630 [Clostridia bacterium]|nr:hypothetical protein [Clostridia bacterium]